MFIDSISKSKKNIANNKGFTLVELIVVLTMMAIVLTLGGLAILKWQDYATFNQENEYAQTLFVAAQNQLSEYSASGRLEVLQSDLKSDDKYGQAGKGIVLDVTKLTSESGSSYNIASVWSEAYRIDSTGGELAAKYIDDIVAIRAEAGQYNDYLNDPQGFKGSNPQAYWVYELLGSYVYDTSILNDAAICVEFTPDDGQVFSVFYSDKNQSFKYSTHGEKVAGAADIDDRQELYRNEYMIGFYGVGKLTKSTRDKSEMAQAEIKNVILHNENTLNLTFNVEKASLGELDYKVELVTGDNPTNKNVAGAFTSKLEITVPGNKIKNTVTPIECPVKSVATDGTKTDLGTMKFLAMSQKPAAGQSGEQVVLILDAADIHAGVNVYKDFKETIPEKHSDDFKDTYSIFRFINEMPMEYLECAVTASGNGFIDSDRVMSENIRHMCAMSVNGDTYSLANARHLYNVRYLEVENTGANIYNLFDGDSEFDKDTDGANTIDWKLFAAGFDSDNKPLAYNKLYDSEKNNQGWSLADLSAETLADCTYPGLTELAVNNEIVGANMAAYVLANFNMSGIDNTFYKTSANNFSTQVEKVAFVLTNNGKISNIAFENGNVVTSGDYAAVVAAENFGLIEDVRITGVSVEGKNRVGGYAGYNKGSIVGTVAAAPISYAPNVKGSHDFIGGVVGYNDSQAVIKNVSVSGGTVTAESDSFYVGGMIGLNKSIETLQAANNGAVTAVTLSSSPSNVTGGYFVGGVIGGNVVKAANVENSSGGNNDRPEGLDDEIHAGNERSDKIWAEIKGNVNGDGQSWPNLIVHNDSDFEVTSWKALINLLPGDNPTVKSNGSAIYVEEYQMFRGNYNTNKIEPHSELVLGLYIYNSNETLTNNFIKANENMTVLYFDKDSNGYGEYWGDATSKDEITYTRHGLYEVNNTGAITKQSHFGIKVGKHNNGYAYTNMRVEYVLPEGAVVRSVEDNITYEVNGNILSVYAKKKDLTTYDDFHFKITIDYKNTDDINTFHNQEPIITFNNVIYFGSLDNRPNSGGNIGGSTGGSTGNTPGGSNNSGTPVSIVASFKSNTTAGNVTGEAFVGGLIGYNIVVDPATSSDAFIRKTVETLTVPNNKERQVQPLINMVNLLEDASVFSSGYDKTNATMSVVATGNAANASTVTGQVFVGGLIGYNDKETHLLVKDSTNYNKVVATKAIENASEQASLVDNQIVYRTTDYADNDYTYTYSYGGGIIGKVSLHTTLDNCQNASTATINVKGTYTGALTEVNKGTIQNCIINSVGGGNEDYLGGLCGLNGQSIYDNTVKPATITGSICDGKIVKGHKVVGLLAAENFGIIQSVDYKNANVEATEAVVGGLTGFNGVSGEIKLENISSVIVKAESGYYAGGIVGINSGKIVNPKGNNTYIEITNSAVSGKQVVGGFIGMNKDNVNAINYLKNTSAVVSATEGDLGGIVGINIKSRIVNCMTISNIHASKGNMGGIVGYNQAGVIDTCTVTAQLLGETGGSNAGFGGIVGYSAGETVEGGNDINASVINCVFQGSLVGKGSSDSKDTYARVGGIVGLNQKKSIVEECYVGRDSSGNYINTYIVGDDNILNITYDSYDNFKSKIKDSVSYTYMGGLIGENYGVLHAMNYNTNSPDTRFVEKKVFIIGGNGAVGGFIGKNSNGGIIDNKNQMTSSVKESKKMFDYGYYAFDLGKYYPFGNEYNASKLYFNIFGLKDNGVISNDARFLVGQNTNGNSEGVGGLIGIDESGLTFECVDNNATVIALGDNTKAGGFIGCVKNVGSSQASVSIARNTGAVYSEGKAGGFIGLIDSKGVTFENAYNFGNINISGDDNSVGGFVGEINNNTRNSDFTNCDNQGIVSCSGDSNYAGGFVGRVSSSNKSLNFENCAQVGLFTGGNVERTGFFVGNSSANIIINFAQCYNATPNIAIRFVGNKEKLLANNSFIVSKNICDEWNTTTKSFDYKNNYFISSDANSDVFNKSFKSIRPNGGWESGTNNYIIGTEYITFKDYPLHYYAVNGDVSDYYSSASQSNSHRVYTYYLYKDALYNYIKQYQPGRLNTPLSLTYDKVDKTDAVTGDKKFYHSIKWNNVLYAGSYEVSYKISLVNPIFDAEKDQYVNEIFNSKIQTANKFELLDDANIKSVEFNIVARELNEFGVDNSNDRFLLDSIPATYVTEDKEILPTPVISFIPINASGVEISAKVDYDNFKMSLSNAGEIKAIADLSYKVICELHEIADDGTVADDCISYVIDSTAVGYDAADDASYIVLPENGAKVDLNKNYLIMYKVVPMNDSIVNYCESEVQYMAPEALVNTLKNKYSSINDISFSPISPISLMSLASFEEEIEENVDETVEEEPQKYAVYFEPFASDEELADLGGYLVEITGRDSSDENAKEKVYYFYMPVDSNRDSYEEIDKLGLSNVTILDEESYWIDEWGVYAEFILDQFKEGDFLKISARGIARPGAENYLNGEYGEAVEFLIDEQLDVPFRDNFELVTTGKKAGVAPYSDEQKAIYEASFNKGIKIKYSDDLVDSNALYEFYPNTSIEMAVALYDLSEEEIFVLIDDASQHSDDIMDDSYWNIGAYKTIAAKDNPIVIGDVSLGQAEQIELRTDYAGMWMKVVFRATSDYMDASDWSDEDADGLSTNYVWIHIPELLLEDSSSMIQIDDNVFTYKIEVPVIDELEDETDSDKEPQNETFDVIVTQQSFDITIDEDVDYYQFDIESFEDDVETISVVVNEVDGQWYLGVVDDGIVIGNDYQIIDGINNEIEVELYDGRRSNLKVNSYIKTYHNDETDKDMITISVPDILSWCAFVDEDSDDVTVAGRGYAVVDGEENDGYLVVKQLEIISGLNEDNDKHKELDRNSSILWKREDNMPVLDIVVDDTEDGDNPEIIENKDDDIEDIIDSDDTKNDVEADAEEPSEEEPSDEEDSDLPNNENLEADVPGNENDGVETPVEGEEGTNSEAEVKDDAKLPEESVSENSIN